MPDWNSKQYMKFERERTQPSKDLISRIEDMSFSRILDLGCGPGNSTFALKSKFTKSEIIGIDASDNMLEKARKDHPNLEFKKCFLPNGLNEIDGKFDLIFSNACIHWIPEQKELLTKCKEKLNVGGILAVQIPFIQNAPFYKILYKLVDEKWQNLSSIKNFHNLMPEEYYDLLNELCFDFDIWQTTYYHTVSSYEGIIDWYKGSGLRPYLEALESDEKRQQFTSELLSIIKDKYPMQSNGNVILKMPRVFFVAKKN